jgi:hypothetical protein
MPQARALQHVVFLDRPGMLDVVGFDTTTPH